MKNKSDNPLNNIFVKDTSGKLTDEIESIKNIHYFFEFLKDDKIKDDTKIKVIEEFKNKLHTSRYISEFFSSYENKSIYIILFDLYINKNATDKLKTSILSLLEELSPNIKTGKDIYQYIFQKLAKIYRGELPATSSNINNYLNLLCSILSEADKYIVKPRNYFACIGGDSKFFVDMKDKKAVEVSYSFSININFKIGSFQEEKNPNKNRIANLVKIFFSNKKEFCIDLKYPCFLIIKEIRNDPIKILNSAEWINLIITVTNFDNKLNLFINVNGENNPSPFKLSSLPIKFDDKIERIEFFNNFYGEVTSMIMFSQKESGPPGVNSTMFLSELKNYKEGLWKRKNIENFNKMIEQVVSVDLKSKSIYFKSTKIEKKEEKKKTLYDSLIFMFTPINYNEAKPDIVEDVLGKYKLQINVSNIRNHLYENYPKKILYVCELNNLFPIAEMFIIYPETLTEDNLELFLKIISNSLNFRKQNLKNIKQYKFFNVLSMFIEKYPTKIFTKKILFSFFTLAKTLFINNYEAICSKYFKHILLNEKIVSKYNTNLQLEFWNQLFLFCQSDKTQIETFININRLCLILRFYDRNKYTEICCQEHLNMIKDEFVGSKKVMNPTMTQKLSNLKNIMDLIIESQEPKNAVSLFKLLTLDLSPCLIKFILNIFIHGFESIKNEKWKGQFVDELLQNKYEVIVANTFMHSLPDVRIELLKFVYQVHLKLIHTNNTNNFNVFEKMIKTCLLPDNMFYSKGSSNKFSRMNNYDNKANNFSSFNKKPEPKKEEPKKIEPKPEPKKEEIKTPETKKEEIKKPEPKKEEIKKPEPKKEEHKIIEPKKPEINKIFEPKKEDNKRPSTTIGGGRQNFLALLSKFDKPKGTTTTNNDIKKSVNTKPFDKKDNPFLKAINNPSVNQKQNEVPRKSVPIIKDDVLKKIEKKEDNKNVPKAKEEKPIKEENKNIPKAKEEKPSIKHTEEVKFPKLKPIKHEKPETKTNISVSTSTNSSNINANKSSPNTIKSSNLSNNSSILENKTNSNKNLNTDLKPITNDITKNESCFTKFNSDGEEIIIKDSEINAYIKKLYSAFMLWSMTIDIDSNFDSVNLDKNSIKVINTIEIIFLLNNKIKNKEYILKFLKTIQKLVEKPENCFELFFGKKVYSSFLDITFENFRKKGKDEEYIYSLGKNIIISLFINALIYCEKQPSSSPGYEIDTILLWGSKNLKDETNKEKIHLVLEFINELFFEFLIQFKVKFEVKLKFDSKNISNIEKNYLLKNYLMFITEMFIFIFRYKFDPDIHKKGTSFLYPSGPKILIPELVSSIRINNNSTIKEIAKDWLDFPLIYDIFSRYKFIWVNNNVYKNLKMEKFKKNKSEKYDYILEKIILDKEKKNLFQKELTLLCFGDKKGDYEYIIPLIEIILQTIMLTLEKLKSTKDENDFLYWLKDLKCFLRFIIIASCNLFKNNEIYKPIQDKCIEPIAAGLCFMHNLLLTSSICKQKIERSLSVLLLLCFKLIKFQFNYEIRHKTIFKLIKQGTNDLGNSALILLFSDYVKDKNGSPLISLTKLESMPLDDNNKCLSSINHLINNKEFISAFFENQNLKQKLYNGIYSLNSYKKLVDYRYDLIPYLLETYDESYKKTILTLLPKYENELAKYSNNSLEKNIKNKNLYKVFKKHAFSWRGYWSSHENFFSETPPQFKYKLINHYTKTFMKPILVPILDISYYLPEFSGFDPKTLFKKDNNAKSKYIVNLDIDKTLKAYDQGTQDANNKEKGKFNNEENYLGAIYKKSNIVLYEKYLKIANNLEFGKEEEFAYIEREETNRKSKNYSKEEKPKKYFLCCLVKTSHHIKGVCFIDDKNLNFKVFLNQKTGSAMSGVEVGFTTNDDDYDQERKTCFGSYFVCHPKDKDLYNISINYNEIKWIFRRRYYYTNSAFEVYTTTNKTYYFNLKYEKDREKVINEILKKLGDYVQIIDDLKETSSSKENIIGFENGIIQKNKKEKTFKLSKKLKSWKSWEISTFELLMWLNIFGNRSYNDISQYPVFPWILSNYTDPLKIEQSIKKANTNMILDNDILNYISGRTATVAMINNEMEEEEFKMDYQYRDMNLPMGMMELNDEGIKRKELFLETYETLKDDPDAEIKPYIYGSNYSNPMYVCNFLMRLFPFTHISIELQGHKFDNPERMFLSVTNSFYNSITQKTDVRELIPEFFYLPEMFRNINRLNMGKLESGEEVNNVKTPCNDNPYDFIMTMKSVLENNRLSRNIQNWIDLIFGYKAKGKEAENAKNLFTEASYQENIDINKVNNKESFLRMVEFGLIPTQVMNKECLKRDKKESIRKGKEVTDSTSDLKYYTCKIMNVEDNIKITKRLAVLQIVSFAPDRISFLLNNNMVAEKKINFSTFEKIYNYEYSGINHLTKYNNKMSEYYHPNKFNGKPFHFCRNSRTLMMGGFFDGKVHIFPLDPKIAPLQIVPFSDRTPIVSICADKDEEFAFFGNTIGNVRIITLDKEPSKYKFYKTITDHMSAISHIDCNSELNLWASASIDGYINIYRLPLCKLIRTIKVPTKKCDFVFLSASPLPSIIVITEEKNVSEIFVYSINGKELLRQKEPGLIYSPIIITDLNRNDYISYILNDSVIIRSIPTLFRQASIDGIKNLYAIYPCEDMKILFATNRSGSEIYIIKDDSKNAK